MSKKFLHVGCGINTKANTTAAFATKEWQEIRYDIDPAVKPDIVGSMLDIHGIEDDSIDAIFSSHNIEHLYPHQVPIALAEFKRVLRPEGFAVITCPDLQSIAALVADDKLTDVAYVSQAGPIAAIDMLYGYRPALQQGNDYMAHKCGFTAKVMTATLTECGFKSIAHARRPAPSYDLWALACVEEADEEYLLDLARSHFPS